MKRRKRKMEKWLLLAGIRQPESVKMRPPVSILRKHPVTPECVSDRMTAHQPTLEESK